MHVIFSKNFSRRVSKKERNTQSPPPLLVIQKPKINLRFYDITLITHAGYCANNTSGMIFKFYDENAEIK